MAQADPKSFLEGDLPLSIDEMQLAPALLREIKCRVDRDRTPGRFLLTGSADLDHCADISPVRAGRVGSLRLPPIVMAEEYEAADWKGWMQAASVKDLDLAFAGKNIANFRWSACFPDSLLAKSARQRMLWMPTPSRAGSRSIRNTVPAWCSTLAKSS